MTTVNRSHFFYLKLTNNLFIVTILKIRTISFIAKKIFNRRLQWKIIYKKSKKPGKLFQK